MGLSWAYFDTSILVKRYLNEEDSQRARPLYRQYRCLTSGVTPVETISTLSRHRASGQMSDRVFTATISRFHNDRNRWELIDVSDLVLRRAAEVIQLCGVKTLDAIHIASALEFYTASKLQIVFLSADQRQRKAAAACGLQVEGAAIAH